MDLTLTIICSEKMDDGVFDEYTLSRLWAIGCFKEEPSEIIDWFLTKYKIDLFPSWRDDLYVIRVNGRRIHDGYPKRNILGLIQIFLDLFICKDGFIRGPSADYLDKQEEWT